MSEWQNQPQDINDYHGFVYLITNTVNNKRYVGKKKFWFKTKKRYARKPTKVEQERLDRYEQTNSAKYKTYKKDLKDKYKGKKKTVRGLVESDWVTYYGSSPKLLADIDKYGADKFTREILNCYKNEFDCTYNELKYQIEHEVLFSTEWYNEIINVRLRKQLKRN